MSDCLFLCATTRLAQTLRGELPGGASVWRTRQAMTLGQWLGSLADEALLSGVADLPVALDPFAERLLWEKVIAGSLTEAASVSNGTASIPQPMSPPTACGYKRSVVPIATPTQTSSAR